MFKPYCCTCIMEREVQTSVVDCQSSMLLPKPRLTINRQCCCRSQGCPLIINAVVKAMLLSKWRSERCGKIKKRRQHQRERTPLIISRWCFPLQALALICSEINHLPCAHAWADCYWQCINVLPILLVWSGQMWPHYADDRHMDNLMYCWVLTVSLGYPYLDAMWRWPPNSGDR